LARASLRFGHRVKKLLKWTAILLSFVLSASIGAYIAAHAKFDQGAVDGGSITGTLPPTTVSPNQHGAAKWHVAINATSEHQLFVGGHCTTRWAGSVTLAVQRSGTFEGAGSVGLQGKLTCDFQVPAKSQVKTIDLKATGTLGEFGLKIELSKTGSTPTLANDLGGFQQTALAGGARSVMNLKLSGPSSGPLRATGKLRRDDGDRGAYTSTVRFVLRCVGNCG
jgi:hypothetical protein